MHTWLIGGGIALVGGGVAAWLFQFVVVKCIDLGSKPDQLAPRIPAWLTGVVERAFFFGLVVGQVSGVPEAMMGWLALKLAANWQRYDSAKEPRAIARSFLALLTGLISLAFAYLGANAILRGWSCGT